MADDLVWVAYFDAGASARKGYDFPDGAVLKVEHPYDARQPDYVHHRMVRLLLAMRRIHGVSPVLELRGPPEVVNNLAAAVEFNWAQIGKQTIVMPQGFVAGRD